MSSYKPFTLKPQEPGPYSSFYDLQSARMVEFVNQALILTPDESRGEISADFGGEISTDGGLAFIEYFSDREINETFKGVDELIIEQIFDPRAHCNCQIIMNESGNNFNVKLSISHGSVTYVCTDNKRYAIIRFFEHWDICIFDTVHILIWDTSVENGPAFPCC